MSFRTRLTSFFVLIVVIPLVAVGVLVFRLISDSQQGKADARANGVASVAASLYQSHSLQARADARVLARALAPSPQAISPSRIATLAAQSGLARVRIALGARRIADVGGSDALAPGTAIIPLGPGRPRLIVEVSELTASEYVRDLASPGTAAVIRAGPRTLASSLQGAPAGPLPTRGTTSAAGTSYRTVTQRFAGFGGQPVFVSVFSSLAATGGSVTGSRILAAVLIAAVLVLAVAFSLMASRGLQGQLSRFLQAARRLGGGDFSSPIETVGRDEFAALGQEFNSMSQQLAGRLDDLSQERARLRDAIHRIGQTFASNLDRSALLDLALKTAIDAVQATAGRVSARENPDKPLIEVVREGALAAMQDGIYDAEREALQTRDCGEAASAGGSVLSVPLGPLESDGRLYGLITVARPEQAFTADDREVLRSLASQAALALENVELHLQVSRQAVTDELTGLSNHRRFQELLAVEMEQVRRYGHSVGLIMVDIDDFKSVNDTYGHQQGDVVLRRVARALADSSRDADLPARYGGEELALILPHTDIEGAHAIAERIRTAIEALRIPRSDGDGPLRITASLGVASSRDGRKEALIAEADAALYEAKRQGKNRTVRARVGAANVFGGE